MSQQLPVYVGSPYITRFKFIQNKILKISNDDCWDQLLMDVEVARGRLFAFKISIIKSKNNRILVGIAEKQARKNEQHSYLVKQAAAYSGRSGKKSPGDVQEGAGFKVGDTVETVVNLDQGKIDWKVNGILQASMVSKYLQKAVGVVVPYITMHHTGDIV